MKRSEWQAGPPEEKAEWGQGLRVERMRGGGGKATVWASGPILSVGPVSQHHCHPSTGQEWCINGILGVMEVASRL